MSMTSADLVADNVAQLRELFPEAFTEGKIDFDVLKQLLGGTVDERDEKYGLNWHGRRRARQLALTPSTGTLRPCPGDGVDEAATQNIVIEGDNLEVLKLLQKSYSGKVKLIYIDPPYNTGKDFVYPDNFQDSIKNYLELTGQVSGGAKITSNPETSGRFHTDWLNMMYPRLKLARNLLREDGAIFISIDDNELHHIRMIADEIFGPEHFISDITVVTNLKGRNDKKHIAPCHEHIVMYSRGDFQSFGLPLNDAQLAEYKFMDEQGFKYALRDLRKRGGPDRKEDRPNMHFPLFWPVSSDRLSLKRTNKSDREILPMRGDGSHGRWRWGNERIEKYLAWLHPKQSERTGRLDIEHRVYLDPSKSIVDDEYDDDEDEETQLRSAKPKSFWQGGELSTDSAKRLLKTMFTAPVFDFPKSVDTLRQCIQIATKESEFILDFFAGSGTTGHAVMAQNAADGGNRRFILVQLPEPLDPANKDQKTAANFCDSLGKPRTIAELTKERLRRAGAKVLEELTTKGTKTTKKDKRQEQELFEEGAEPLDSSFRAIRDFRGKNLPDLGFKVFKLDSSNIRTWDPDPKDLVRTLTDSIQNIKLDRNHDDVLTELLLKLGLDLCVPVEEKTIAGKKVHNIGAGSLFVCLAKDLLARHVEPVALGIVEWWKQLAPAGETQVVFRDSAFENDVAKSNLVAILTQHGLGNVRSI